MLDSIDGYLGAVVQSQFAKDIADVGLDSLLANDQGLGDLAVAPSLGDKAGDLQFPLCQLWAINCFFTGRLSGNLFHQFANYIRMQTGFTASCGPDGLH